jgi:hypothetical protein
MSIEQAPEPDTPRSNGVPNPGISAAEMGAASFPASDAPATWTWDVPQSRTPSVTSTASGSIANER